MGTPSIGIAGAGPAGLALAVMLRRLGWRVTLADRFSAPAPVGSGLMLQPTGLRVLKAIGLDPIAKGLGAPIDRILGRRSDTGRVVLDVGYGAGKAGSALGVHRSTLFGLLHDAALSAGAELVSGFEVAAVEYETNRPFLASEGRRLGPFDLVVDALGARSALGPCFGAGQRRLLGYGALWASVPWPGEPFLEGALEQRYRKAHTMVGILPVGTRWGESQPMATFFWSLRGDRYADWRTKGIEAWKREVEGAWPEVSPVLECFKEGGDLTFARYSHHTLRRPITGRVVAIGDAAHSTSPQLGQGANMALLDAYALASALSEQPDIDRALRRYAAARRWHIRLYQALSLGLTPLYQSDAWWPPLMRDHLLRPLALTPFAPPILAAAVSGRLLGPRPPQATFLNTV